MEFFSSSVTNTLQSSVKYNYIIYFNLKFCINLLNVTKFCMYHKHVSLYIASMAAIKFSPYLNEFISVTVMPSKSKVCPNHILYWFLSNVSSSVSCRKISLVYLTVFGGQDVGQVSEVIYQTIVRHGAVLLFFEFCKIHQLCLLIF